MKSGNAVKKAEARNTKWIPTLCKVCVEGPDLLRVQVVDGVAVNVEGNTDIPGCSTLAAGQGRICPKPLGLIQKLYNPYRLKNPVKRTNPEKGRGIDPGWVEISWEEALDTIAEKLKSIRATNTRKLAVDPVGPQKVLALSNLTAFMKAFGPTQPLESGNSAKCDTIEHQFGNVIHSAFNCEPDMTHCNYLISMGANESASGGAPQNVQYSDARMRGLKVVQVDPFLSVSASKAHEWLPIRPGTDTAFLLGLIHVILHELKKYDAIFLKEMTNSPYLVGPDGNFVRDANGKVLMWDTVDQKAKAHDDPTVKDVALEGTFVVDGKQCRTSLQMLKDHVKESTPEWAEKITDIPAATIRRVAHDFIEAASIGQTITLDGVTLPYRPVSTKTGRGVSGVPRGYSKVLAIHILVALAGALEVPGAHGSGVVQEAASGMSRFKGVEAGPDGMKKIEVYDFTWPPISLDGAETLTPYAKNWGRINHLGYMNLAEPLENYTMPPIPELYINWRSNPLLALGQPEIIEKALKKIGFIVSINYTQTEFTELADIVLPEHSELERYESLVTFMRPSLHKKWSGMLLGQPVVKPLHNSRDLHFMLTELADRLGILAEYNEQLSNNVNLKPEYRLKPDKKYTMEEFVDLQCKNATNGEHDLEWFKEHGAILKAVPAENQYGVHLKMKANKLRYSLPYMEHVKKTGEKLKKDLAGVGINWWPTEEYVPLPTYLPSVVEEIPAEYDFYVGTNRIAQYNYGNNVDIPWFIDMAKEMLGQEYILMNDETARAKGIKDGDDIVVESPVGKLTWKVQLVPGIRRDMVMVPGQFGHWATPVARDTGRVSLTPLIPLSVEWTDPVIGQMQGILTKAKVYKVQGGKS